MSLLRHHQLLMSRPDRLWTPLDLFSPPSKWMSDQSIVLLHTTGQIENWYQYPGSSADTMFSNLTASTSPNYTTLANGLSGASFDGSSDYLSSPAGSAETAAMPGAWCMTVYRKRSVDAVGTNRAVFSISTNNSSSVQTRFGVWCGLESQPNRHCLQSRRADANSVSILAGSVLDTQYHMHLDIVNYSTRTGQLYLDGALDAQNTSFTTTGSTGSNTAPGLPETLGAYRANIGFRYYSDIDLVAMLFSPTILASGEIDKLFGWAAHRYGLTALLPIGHPYKTLAPTA